MRKVVRIALSDLKRNLFVRYALNQDHALVLAQLIEDGVSLPPIKVAVVDGQYGVVDGRHRIEAYDLNGITEVEAEVLDISDEIEMIAMAYKANVGGPLPPTSQDIEHTIEMLLERNVPKKHIGERLGLSAGMARKYINTVQSKMTRAKMQRAAMAVTDDGLTIASAADRFDVDPDSLKEVLSGRRRKYKKGIATLKPQLTSISKSLSLRYMATIRRLIEQYDDGDVSEKQVREVIKHIEHLQKKAARSFADWKSRFEAKVTAKSA